MSNECITCPFSWSDESAQAQNYGCLPTGEEILKLYEQGRYWMCHGNENKVCSGLKNHLAEKFNVKEKEPIKYSKWYVGEL